MWWSSVGGISETVYWYVALKIPVLNMRGVCCVLKRFPIFMMHVGSNDKLSWYVFGCVKNEND